MQQEYIATGRRKESVARIRLSAGTGKIEVNGRGTHPLYKFLKSQAKGIFGTERIKWNFTKFLVDTTGQVVARYAPTAKPQRIERDVEALL